MAEELFETRAHQRRAVKMIMMRPAGDMAQRDAAVMRRSRQRHDADHRAVAAIAHEDQPRVAIGVEQVQRRLQAPALGKRIGFACVVCQPVPPRRQIVRYRQGIDHADRQRRAISGRCSIIDRKGRMHRHRPRA